MFYLLIFRKILHYFSSIFIVIINLIIYFLLNTYKIELIVEHLTIN